MEFIAYLVGVAMGVAGTIIALLINNKLSDAAIARAVFERPIRGCFNCKHEGKGPKGKRHKAEPCCDCNYWEGDLTKWEAKE
jgi:hypothetical protein